MRDDLRAAQLTASLARAPRGVATDAARILRSACTMSREGAANAWGFPDPRVPSPIKLRTRVNSAAWGWASVVVEFAGLHDLMGAGAPTRVAGVLAAMHYDPSSRRLLRLPFDTVALLAGCDHPLAGAFLPALRARDDGYLTFSPI